MSEHSTPEEKTEDPTDRRMGQLRKEGGLHLSTEIVVVTSLMAGFIALQFLWSWMLESIKGIMVLSFKMISDSQELDLKLAYDLTLDMLYRAVPPVFVLTVLVSVSATCAVFFQTNFNVKKKWIDVKFAELSPHKGIGRVFSINGMVTTLKSIAKLGIILPIGFFALKAMAPKMVMLIHLGIDEVMAFTGLGIMELFWKIMYVLIALALIDYFYTKWQWLRQNKMTKDEVKDERKSIEGDESTKRQMKQKGIERIVQRIRESVPQADVVITNPTHYAIALKYDRENMDAPIIVAKGKGFLALRIRELAKESGVPVLERKILARALFKSAEIGSQIPHELFKAVAEVLAHVYKLKNKRFTTART